MYHPIVVRDRHHQCATFLLNEVFQPNHSCRVSKQMIGGEVPAVICEDTLANLGQVRELVQSSPTANWKHRPNGKNFVDYKDCRVRYPVMAPLELWQLAINVVRQAYDKKTVPGVDDLDVNCFFQINERRADTSYVHEDVYAEAQLFTCLLYLNSAPECSGGTAFYGNLTFGQATSPSNESIEQFYDQNPNMLEDGSDYWPTGWEQQLRPTWCRRYGARSYADFSRSIFPCGLPPAGLVFRLSSNDRGVLAANSPITGRDPGPGQRGIDVDAHSTTGVILWSAPRCTSTLFEHSIGQLPHVKTFHEVFTNARLFWGGADIQPLCSHRLRRVVEPTTGYDASLLRPSGARIPGNNACVGQREKRGTTRAVGVGLVPDPVEQHRICRHRAPRFNKPSTAARTGRGRHRSGATLLRKTLRSTTPVLSIRIQTS